jgi:hypothetical protein
LVHSELEWGKLKVLQMPAQALKLQCPTFKIIVMVGVVSSLIFAVIFYYRHLGLPVALCCVLIVLMYLFGTFLNVLVSLILELENRLLSRFDVASQKRELSTMAECAKILSQVGGSHVLVMLSDSV